MEGGPCTTRGIAQSLLPLLVGWPRPNGHKGLYSSSSLTVAEEEEGMNDIIWEQEEGGKKSEDRGVFYPRKKRGKVAKG